MEPPIIERETSMLLERDESWHAQRLPLLEDRIRKQLGALSGRLGGADWLDGEFSAGDLVMVGVLRRLNGSGLLKEYSRLAAYVTRGEVRPPSSVPIAPKRRSLPATPHPPIEPMIS